MRTELSWPVSEVESRGFISRVFGWMGGGLALTGWAAWMVARSSDLTQALVMNRTMFFGLIILQFALVLFLSAGIHRMTTGAAALAFIVYSVLNGVTLSVIFLAYTAASVASTFFVTAGVFGIMAFYGAVTKRDLTSLGHLLFMSLIGLILASLVNLFLHSEALVWVTTYAGILIFVGLTAYDTQKIKNLQATAMDEETASKASILGALALYLDFVNLFLFILRATGRRR